jgi:hypothetical protein
MTLLPADHMGNDHPTRRKVVAGTTSALPVIALTRLPAIAGSPTGPDAQLLRLWEQYLSRAQSYATARAVYEPVRAAFGEELSRPCPLGVSLGDHWSTMATRWRSYGLPELSDACEQAAEDIRAAIAAIRAVPAEGLIGIGIKLAALPVGPDATDEQELAEAIFSASEDIARLTGADFAGLTAHVEPRDRDHTCWV